MKKIIIIGILVIMALMLTACGQKKAPEEPVAQPEAKEEVVKEEITQEEIVVEEITEKEVVEEIEEPEEPEEEPEKVEPGISQEDLDKLKEDLEGMEFEDLGGLAE